jgi:hypothetical protein
MYLTRLLCAPQSHHFPMSFITTYTFYKSYHWLKVSVGRKYRGPLYFLCGLENRVACNYIDIKICTDRILSQYSYS